MCASPLRVLLYHRVDDQDPEQIELNPDLTTATPSHFEWQLRHLTRAYHPVGADEVLAAFRGQHVLPRRAVLVTFDDGYRDFHDIAWPLLKQYGVPAVLFVPTAFLDAPTRMFWPDALWQMIRRSRRMAVVVPQLGRLALGTPRERLDTFRVLVGWLKNGPPSARHSTPAALAETFGVQLQAARAVLTWSDVRKLAADGVTMAAHSRTHERLDQLGPEARWSEVDGSRADLVNELGACAPLFAYPYGDANPPAVKTVHDAGFALAFTTVCGVSDLHRSHPLLLRRDDGRASARRFVIRLSEPFASLRTLRHPYPKAMRVAR